MIKNGLNNDVVVLSLWYRIISSGNYITDVDLQRSVILLSDAIIRRSNTKLSSPLMVQAHLYINTIWTQNHSTNESES